MQRCESCKRYGKSTFFLRYGVCWQCAPENERCIKCHSAHKSIAGDLCHHCERPDIYPDPTGEYIEIAPPKRKKSRPKRKGVYLLSSDYGWYKIGCTSDLKTRLKTFSGWLPFEIKLEHFFEMAEYYAFEQDLHKRYKAKRIRNTEWFALSPEDVEEIKSIGTFIYS
jgi:hypothetical protein